MRYLNSDLSGSRGDKKISKIGLGTWQFGTGEWGYGKEYAETEAAAIVRRALELGVTLFDTAEVYGFGKSERILGQALGKDLSSVFLATKIMPVLPGAAVVKRRAAASAKRLGAQTLDLYQVHQPNPVVRDGTLMRGMRALQQTGQVGEVGVSNYTLKRWQAAERALGSPVFSNQVRYNLLVRSPDKDLIPYAAEHGRVVIAYSPLAQGLLSGRYHEGQGSVNLVRKLNPLYVPANLERSADLIATLRTIADAHSATPTQIALAWAIHHPCVAAIPGASSVAQLESNAAAADIVLSDQEYETLSAASDQVNPITGAKAMRSRLTAKRH